MKFVMAMDWSRPLLASRHRRTHVNIEFGGRNWASFWAIRVEQAPLEIGGPVTAAAAVAAVVWEPGSRIRRPAILIDGQNIHAQSVL
jgi:hypothetical protein